MVTKKTLLIATDNFLPRLDGISRFLEMTIPELESKYNVILIAPNFQGKFQKKGNYTIHRFPVHKITVGDISIPKRPSSKIIDDLVDKADLVFTQTMGPIGLSVINSASKKEKLLLSFVHSIEWILVEKSLARINILRSILSLITKLYVRRMYNKCTGIIVPSSDVAEILSLLGVKRPKYIVRLGINTEQFKPNNKVESKLSLGFSESDFIVGYVGRIAREKNLLTLLNGFKKIDNPQKKLLIVGEGIPSLKRKLSGNKVTITGRVFDVVPYLNAMDVFVMPSLTETTCLAALEAMSCEVPVIATKVGSIPHYITHNKNGYLFPKKNSSILAIRLNHLNDHPLQAKSVAKAGRRTVLQNYSWDSTKQQLLKIMEHYLK
jgi:glycosyltransferase involved in cell wall biosynthesis